MAEINENSLYNAFGIENPADAGQSEAAPAAETAAPESAAAETAAAEESGAEAQDTGSDAGEQSVEERRANAARRREAERQAAINDAVNAAITEERAKAKAANDSFFSRAKLKNTITGEPIKTIEDFDAWESAYNERKLQQDLKAGRLTKDGLDAAIAAHPSVKAAQELISQNEAAAKQQQNAAMQAKIAEEIAEIGKMDPNIKSVSDLTHMPNAKEFYGYVQKGLSFIDAYYLVNKDAVTAAAADAARTSALNNQRGKDHLNATGNSRGAGAMTVPAEELRMFKLFNPKATPAEIQAFYNKYKS